MPTATGVWVSYGEDRAAIFSAEVGALRDAVEHKCEVVFWRFGMTLADAIAGAQK